MVEDDLLWKTTFSGRQPSVYPCMLPTPLCGIFSYFILKLLFEIFSSIHLDIFEKVSIDDLAFIQIDSSNKTFGKTN